ncbi:MAG: amidotransferase [Spirochaetales bacterium]|nr:amidotransferase [Spirochaetales bacterium]
MNERKRVGICTHVPFEGPGMIRDILIEKGFTLDPVPLWDNAPVPDPSSFDLLVVMGGPMGAGDEDRYPWLGHEKRCIRGAVDSGKKVLGVCLGAQLIASALGSAVYRHHEKEIGWFPVKATPAGIALGLPAEYETFHWHGDTFDIPEGAELMASSEACKNQGFILGDQVLAFQFHPEVTREAVQAFTQACAGELVPSRFVQTADQLLKPGPDRYLEHEQVLRRVMERFLGH